MNTHTGQVMDYSKVQELPAKQRRNWIEVKRDLTVKETSDAQIRLYAPCGCGSGKKFKFCCKK